MRLRRPMPLYTPAPMRTEATLKAVTDKLQINHGDLHDAARTAGISPAFLFQWIKDDEEAGKAIEEAQRVGWAGLVSVMTQRATVGVTQDIYYKGEVVGHKQEYSDSLLVKLAEAYVPEFSKKADAGTGSNVNVQVNLMPRADNYDEWLLMKQTTLDARAQAALPAPAVKIPEVLTGEYVEVKDDPMACLRGLGL